MKMLEIKPSISSTFPLSCIYTKENRSNNPFSTDIKFVIRSSVTKA